MKWLVGGVVDRCMEWLVGGVVDIGGRSWYIELWFILRIEL